MQCLAYRGTDLLLRQPFSSLDFLDGVFGKKMTRIIAMEFEPFFIEVTMIDPINDKLIPFCKLSNWCEQNLGHRVSPSTLHRWRLRGIRGVKLETILIGGKRFTGESQLLCFFRTSTQVQDDPTASHNSKVSCRIADPQGHDESVAFLKSEGI